MLAGFGLHVGQNKLFACFYFFIFSGIMEQLFFRKFIRVQTHTQTITKEYVSDF